MRRRLGRAGEHGKGRVPRDRSLARQARGGRVRRRLGWAGANVNIVLVGYRGAGKSSVATILAQRLSWPLISTDAEIVKKAGLSVPEIIQKRGWDYFRDVESQICQRLGKKDRTIIDTGGGVVLRKENEIGRAHV